MQDEKVTGGLVLGFEDQCLGIWAKWSQFLPNVIEDPPKVGPDLQTQKVVLSKKIKFREKKATWRVALGFGDQCFSDLGQQRRF